MGKIEWWTLEQALAWVVYRDEDIVNDIAAGQESLLLLRMYKERGEKHSFCPLPIASRSLLKESLQQGELKAEGIYNNERSGTANTKKTIPCNDWRDCEIKNPTTPSGDYVLQSRSTKAIVWEQIILDQKTVITLFPVNTIKRAPLKRGTKTIDDSDLLQKMHNLIKSDQSISIHAAAQGLAHKAKGGGTEGSKADRLSKKYKEEYPKRTAS